MTVQDLHLLVIDRPNNEFKDKKRQNDIDDIDSQLFTGVDISSLLHKSVSSNKRCATIDTVPPVPLLGAFNYVIKHLHSGKTKLQLDLLLCFDGASHPLKAGTDSFRKASRKAASANLTTLYAEDTTTMEDVIKQRRALAYPREDLLEMIVDWCKRGLNDVPICSAPFEAEWQLVYMQNAGFLGSIISDDGDAFVLGGDNIISYLDWDSGSCCIYEREKIQLITFQSNYVFTSISLLLVYLFVFVFAISLL
jgi:5'-3' exonuclease